jgi:hypothetical protein
MAVTMEDDHGSGANQSTVPDIMVLWGVVTELSEQLTRNRSLAGTLRSQLTELNVCISVEPCSSYLLRPVG